MDRLVAERRTDLEARLLRAEYRRRNGDRFGVKADLEFAYREIPGAAADPRVVREYAQQLRGDGDLAAAEAVLRTARAAAPADVDLMSNLGAVLIATGVPAKVAEGRDLVRAVSAALPDGDGRLLPHGDRLLALGDRDGAQAVADRLATAADRRDLAGYLTGRLALLDGDWPTARARLQAAVPALRATAADADLMATAHLSLAAAHAAAQDPAAQLAAARAALALRPGWTEAKLVAADALVRTDKRGEALDLLRALAVTAPAARAQLARLLLADALTQPASVAGWREFEAAIGSPPYPPDIAALVLQARIAQGDPKVPAELEAELKKSPASVPAWLALIAFQSDRDPPAARKSLDAAAAAAGDRVELRLARAALLARDPALAEAGPLARLADGADRFPVGEREQLFRGLAAALTGRGFRAEALKLVRAAADLRPFDLAVRLTLFDLGNQLGDAAATDFAVAEIRRLDGADGALARVADVSRAMAATPAPTADQRDEWRARLTAAVAARDGWARPHALLGELARQDKKADEALGHFLKAIDRGGAGEGAVRAAVELLLAQQKYDGAMKLMADLDRAGGLTPALRTQYQLRRAAAGDDPARALQIVRAPEMAASENFRDHLDRSFVFMLHGEPREAKAALDKALARNNSAPDVWLARVRYLAAVVSVDDARKEVELATAKLSGTPDRNDPLLVPLTLGRCRELVGQFDKAEAEYRRAAQLDSKDVRPADRLHQMFLRTNRGPDAAALLAEFAAADGPVGKWARRQAALRLAGGPDAYARIPDALKLIDKNLADGGNDLEDVRAKAFVRAADPFQRPDALATLTASLARGPMTPLETLNYARMQAQAGQPEEAVRLLVASTAAGSAALLDQLALLARLHTEAGDRPPAQRAVDRLKLLDPFGWDTAVEAARLLARTDKPAAAKVLLAHRAAEKPEVRVAVVARLLEEFGCPAEAQPLYEKWNETSPAKDRHLPLAQFLIRQKQGEAALTLALARAADVPAGMTARLLAGAVRCRHPDAVPAAEREAWRLKVADATRWVAENGEKEPASADFALAQAELADARGDYAEAVRLYGLVADRTDRSELKAGMRNNRAWLLAAGRRDATDEALRLVNEAIAARGPLPYFLDTRAVVKLAANRPEEALADLDVAVAMDAKPTYHFHRALALDRLGKADLCKAALAMAVKRGLTRDDLHPLEWPDFDRLTRK